MSYQKTVIVGYVGSEVAVHQIEDETVANFSVAVNEKFRESSKTTWFQTSAWGSLSDLATKHIITGQLLLIEGRVSADAWIDANDKLQISLQLTAQKIRLIGGKPSTEEE